MSSMLARLKKNSTSKIAAPLGKVKLPAYRAVSPAYGLNIALGGDLKGALRPGHLCVAGESRHFKTNICLLLAAAWLDEYPDAALLFVDTEWGTGEETVNYFRSCGVDTDRVFHAPVEDVEEMKFEITKQLNGLEKDDKLIIVVDSIGGSASRKEAENADDGHSAQDMGLRAKAINSMFRVITPKLKRTGTPLLSVNHVYGDQYSKTISGGQKILLSADDAWILGKRQGDKVDGEIQGHEFIINIEKSRTVKEKRKIPLIVTYEGGVEFYSPLFDIAKTLGFIVSPSRGWWTWVDPTTGEAHDKNFREKEIRANEGNFWEEIAFKTNDFNDAIRARYRLDSNALIKAAEEELKEIEEIEAEIEADDA